MVQARRAGRRDERGRAAGARRALVGRRRWRNSGDDRARRAATRQSCTIRAGCRAPLPSSSFARPPSGSWRGLDAELVGRASVAARRRPRAHGRPDRSRRRARACCRSRATPSARGEPSSNCTTTPAAQLEAARLAAEAIAIDGSARGVDPRCAPGCTRAARSGSRDRTRRRTPREDHVGDGLIRLQPLVGFVLILGHRGTRGRRTAARSAAAPWPGASACRSLFALIVLKTGAGPGDVPGARRSDSPAARLFRPSAPRSSSARSATGQSGPTS